MPAASLVGRESEVAAVTDLIAGVRDRGARLVVRGEAGIGKSSLLAAASESARARGLLVLRTSGVQSEGNFPFAGLHQLLRPLLGRLDELPPPQRSALQAAFGMSENGEAEPFLIGLATLELLGDAAASTPILLAADDVHWLDRPTSDVLAFVARRIDHEPIVLLLAIRNGHEDPLADARLPELALDPLSDAAAGTLLDARTPGLAADVRARLLSEAAGNPLALVELPAALHTEQLAGDEALPENLPLTTKLEQAFAAQAAELPAQTRSVLLVAALDARSHLDELLRAVDGATVDSLSPAVDAQLVEVNGVDIRFRHPLIRSAITQAASDGERRAAHLALAETLGEEPERRAWHLAAAALGPDEAVAAELEELAGRAERRGGALTAVSALEIAASLSPDAGDAAHRLLRAADLGFEAGRPELGLRLLDRIEPVHLGPIDRLRLSFVREAFAGGAWTGASRVRPAVAIADRMREQGESDLALSSLMSVALRLWWGNPDQEARDLVMEAAERLEVPAESPELILVLAAADPVARGPAVLERLSRHSPDAADPRHTLDLGSAAGFVGDFARSLEFLESGIGGIRTQGRLGLLAQMLVTYAWAANHLGRPQDALPAAEEAGRLARETGQPRWAVMAGLMEAMVAATRGDEPEAERLSAEAESVLLPMGANPLLSVAQVPRGLTALGAGRHEDAYEHLGRIFDPADIAYHPFVRWYMLGDLVEAAVHTGHEEKARAALDDLEPVGDASRSPLLLANLAYARPLLAGDDAEPLFLAGLDADLVSSFRRARLLLAYGEWLRRRRRVAESRAPLRAALESFEALATTPWAERARQELRASGETSRRRTPDAWAQLSPQELQIARMAAQGMTNREIGQKLFLSHRTIGSHLYRVFPKLGITSRAQLVTAIQSSD